MTNEELLKDHAGDLIKKLLAEVTNKGVTEVRFEFEDNEQWSLVNMHIEEEDREISLRLFTNDRYELFLGYYDEEDEFFEISRPLTPAEKDLLPKGLQKVMGKVLADEQGMRLPGNLLAK